MNSIALNAPASSFPTNVISHGLKKLGEWIFSIYFFGAMLALPYFNWQYAQSEGFFNWMLFGQIVPTAQVFIWPYYAVAKFTSRFDIDPHFVKSRKASYEAMLRINQAGSIEELTPNHVKDILPLLRAAVAEAELVDDAYLIQCHPEFVQKFREGYTQSLRDLADGMESGDGLKQMVAGMSFLRFSDWVSENEADVKF